MPSPRIKNKEKYNNKLPQESGLLGGHPWIRLAMARVCLVEGKKSLLFRLRNANNVFCMEDIENLCRNIDRKGTPLKNVFIPVLSFELWHLYKSLLPSVKGLSMLSSHHLFIQAPTLRALLSFLV
jgi:hypothetical protein